MEPVCSVLLVLRAAGRVAVRGSVGAELCCAVLLGSLLLVVLQVMLMHTAPLLIATLTWTCLSRQPSTMTGTSKQ